MVSDAIDFHTPKELTRTRMMTDMKNIEYRTLYTHPKHIGLYEHWGFKRLKTAYVIFHDESHYKEAGFID